MRALQGWPVHDKGLDIHFSIPRENPWEKDANQGTLVVFNLDPSVTNEQLWGIFGAYGEIKEIRETPHKKHHKVCLKLLIKVHRADSGADAVH